jgi:NitT/TauT family transport system substrate-binding protein
VVILAKTKVKEAIERFPELKATLIGLSPRFRLLNNNAVFTMVSRWATFGDVARMGDLSICEVLHKVNAAIGAEKELLSRAPDCIKDREERHLFSEEPPEWTRNIHATMDVRGREDFFLPEVLEAIRVLKEGETLKVTNDFYPAPLIEMLYEEGYEIFYEAPSFHEHIVYVLGKSSTSSPAWAPKKETFPLLDTAAWGKDFFSSLVREAEALAPGNGFYILLKTPPDPIINTVETLGFESLTEKTAEGAYKVFFYKTATRIEGAPALMRKVPLVIQSATPVVYPILMRMLESKRLMRAIRVDELKIWDKTEKHLGWIVNKKADISFSAVAAVAKLYQKGLDIKMTAIAVWDNFFILTRGFKAKDFGDLQGRKIYLPLIKAAPPYAVTTFLMSKFGYDPNTFEFVFGKPFGRPEDIKAQLLSGEAEVALLREPEASFTIHEGEGIVHEAIAYRDLWETLFPGQGNLPNAGLLFKGEILRNYPDLAEMFMEETKDAAIWVNENREESARMIAEVMNVSTDAAARFLSRAHLEVIPSSEVLNHVMHYIDVLNKSGYGGKPFGEIRPLFD